MIPPIAIPPLVVICAFRNVGFVEAPVNEVARRSAGLRAADRVDVFHITGERVGDALVISFGVAQEGREIADRGKAEPNNIWAGGGVVKLI